MPLPPRGHDNSVSETDYLYLYIFMFKNLFGKKNDGFFMQVDESKPATDNVESQAPEQKTAAAAKTPIAAAKFKNPFSKTKEVSQAAPAKDEVVAAPLAIATAEEVSSAAEPAEIVAAPESTKATKTSIKDKKKQEKAGKKDTKAAPSPEKVAPVAAPAQVFTNFATDYLIQPSSNGSRRRPGANMKNFVTMAREVKVTK